MLISMLVLANALLATLSLYYAYKASYLLVPWVSLFTAIWTLPISVIWYLEGVIHLSYVFKIFQGLQFPDKQSSVIVEVAILVVLATLFMLLGSSLANSTLRFKTGGRVFYKNTAPVISFLFLSWCFLVFLLSSINGIGLKFILLPSYAEENAYVNYIFKYIYLFIPFVATFLIVGDANRKKLLYIVVFWALFTAFSTGQRRDFLSYVLFFGYLFYRYRYREFVIARFWSFNKFLIVFICAFASVPLLWYARVFFTNLLAKDQIINPLYTRGFGEIIFGSGSTGMPTLFVVIEWLEKASSSYFYNIYYGVVQIVPRFLWDNKPVGIDTIIKDGFKMEDSPSPFWFGDIAFSYGIYSLPVASLLLGFFITFVQKFMESMERSAAAAVSAFIFCNVFALYKNGLGTYLATVINGLVIILFIYSVSMLVARSRKEDRI